MRTFYTIIYFAAFVLSGSPFAQSASAQEKTGMLLELNVAFPPNGPSNVKIYIYTDLKSMAVMPIYFNPSLTKGPLPAAVSNGKKVGSRCFFSGEICMTVKMETPGVFRITHKFDTISEAGGQSVLMADVSVRVSRDNCDLLSLNGGKRKYRNLGEYFYNAQLSSWTCKKFNF